MAGRAHRRAWGQGAALREARGGRRPRAARRAERRRADVARAGPGIVEDAVSAAPARTPPRVARALLRALLPDHVRDDVDGDLHEIFVKRRAERGAPVAVAWYWVTTFSFIM